MAPAEAAIYLTPQSVLQAMADRVVGDDGDDRHPANPAQMEF
jgi:hypothetical protein